MKQFVVYDSAGNILRTGLCQDHMVGRQAKLGEKAIEGRARDTEHRVVNGRIVPIDKGPPVEPAAVPDGKGNPGG